MAVTAKQIRRVILISRKRRLNKHGSLLFQYARIETEIRPKLNGTIKPSRGIETFITTQNINIEL